AFIELVDAMKREPFLPSSSPEVEVTLDRLARMDSLELQRLHVEILGWAPSDGNAEHVRRTIAWHIQAEREGGLPESVRQRGLALAPHVRLRMRVTDARRYRSADPFVPLKHAAV